MSSIAFAGQVAVVTGAAGGLGRSFALELASRGARVLVNDLPAAPGEPSLADAVVAEITSRGGIALASHDSVATASGGQAMIDAARDAWGRVDIVINNAGNQANRRFGDFTEADIDAVLAVHLKGAFHVTQPAYRQMCEQGYGRILMVSSQSGIFGNPYRANYGAAKTGLIGLMNVIAQEAPAGITVNCLFPNATGGRLGSTTGAPRIDADFLAAAGSRSRQYIKAMDPSFVTPLALWLVARDCNSSQGMYSALGGKYARIFTGLGDGWYKGGETAPTVDDIARHWTEISAITPFITPQSGYDEMDGVLEALERHKAGQK